MSEKIGSANIWDKINRNTSPSKLPFNMEVLAEQCIAGDYVLVLGSSVMLDWESELAKGYDGDSERMLLDGALKQGGSNLALQICQCVKQLCDNQLLSSEFLNPLLKELLAQRCFRTIVTTAFDPYLECYLEGLWKKPFDVLNINSDEKEDSHKDISSAMIHPNEFNKTTPLLYYAFGKAEYKNLASNKIINEFAATDNEKMKIVAQWLGNQAPANFLKHLGHKRILAIGCKFDDWLFRFFWYMLQKDINLLDKGEVVFDYIEETDASLKDYLCSQRVEFFENARLFMSDLVRAIEKVRENAVARLRVGQNDRLKTLDDNGIFISYAHEDFWMVNPLYEKLTSLGFNVWMDVRLEAGDKYDTRIEAAINHCKVFIPVLSSVVGQSLETGECEKRYFYNKEWMTAQNRIGVIEQVGGVNMEILPILVDSFDIGNDYHGRLLPFIKTIHSYDIGRQKIEVLINKLIDFTKNKSDE